MAAAPTTPFMDRLFFYPDRSPFLTPPGAEDVRFPTTDGLSLHGWFFAGAGTRTPGARRPTVLFVHGNAGNVANHADFATFLVDAGISVLVFDYRAYGRSDAPKRTLRREDLLDDTNAALDYLLDRNDVDPHRVGLYGYSLGAVLGLAVAPKRSEVRCVAAGGGFASWHGIAGDHAPGLGWLLVRRGHDAADNAARLGQRPLLVVHGARDEIVPVAHAGRIAGAAKDGGVFVETYISDDGTHNGLIWEDPAVPSHLTAFFATHLK